MSTSRLLPAIFLFAATAPAFGQAVAIDNQTTDGTSSISRLQLYTTISVGAIGQISVLQSRLKFGSAGYLNVDSAAATTPSAGDLRYDAAGSTLQFYTSSWQTVVTGGNAAYVQNQTAADQSASFRLSGTGQMTGTAATQFSVTDTSTTDGIVAIKGVTSSVQTVTSKSFYALWGESNLGDNTTEASPGSATYTYNYGVRGTTSGSSTNLGDATINYAVFGVSNGAGPDADSKVLNIGTIGLAGLTSASLPPFANLSQTLSVGVYGESTGSGAIGGMFQVLNSTSGTGINMSLSGQDTIGIRISDPRYRGTDIYVKHDTAGSTTEIAGVRSYAESSVNNDTIYGGFFKAQDISGSNATGETYYGIYAEARIGQTANYGVWARADGGAVGGANQGLHAECYGNTAAASTNYGIYGTCSGGGTGASTNYGLYATCSNGNAVSTGYGLYATATGSGTLWAGYFTGAATACNRNAIGSASTDGMVLVNDTAAAATTQQWSPRLRLTGQGWKTNATAASQTVDWMMQVVPVQGAANPTSYLDISSQVNGAGYASRMALQSDGTVTIGTTTDQAQALYVQYDTNHYGYVAGSDTGVYASAFSTSATQWGGYFTAANNSGNTNTLYGVYGYLNSWGTQYGVYGYANGSSTASSTSYGVYGQADASYSSGASYGVYGKATSTLSTINYGVYGQASGATTNWAGYFDGHVSIKQKTLTVELTAAVALSAGQVVIVDTAADLSCTTTTTAAYPKVLGVVVYGGAAATTVSVAVDGIVDVIVNNTVSRGDYLKTATTAGRVDGTTVTGVGIIGIALTAGSAGGTVKMMFIKAENF